jgi:hypothetical protein
VEEMRVEEMRVKGEREGEGERWCARVRGRGEGVRRWKSESGVGAE